jgi:hypothetical protein
MKPPIFITESNDISVHPTVKHAEQFLELQDVKDNIYTAYDSEGNLLNLSTGFIECKYHFIWLKWTKRCEIVMIRDYDPPINQITELRTKIVNFLTYKGISDAGLISVSTEELIKRMYKYMPWRLPEH